MRFRRIEKSGGMANVGLKDQHIQGKEDDVTTANSKTYIGSKGKQKLAMNKIKNTKIGDDIHYYINGLEGRGIVVKMANEYLEIFKEDGQLGTIHINDTFFVKDILINKQWDDMDDIERYDALTKIHAPSPRYIAKTWNDIPEEIKILLQKEGGNMAGGTGSTYEKGETKDSETQDHARTGFAQSTQYTTKETEDEYYKKFTHSGERKETRAAQEKEILGHHTSQSGTRGGRWAAEQDKKKQEEMAKKKKEEVEAKKKEPKKEEPKADPKKDKPDSTGRFTVGGKFIPKDQRKKAFYEEWLEKKVKRPSPRTAHGSFGTTLSEAGQEAQSNFSDSTASAAGALGVDFGTATTKARPSPRTGHGSFGTTQSEEGQKVQADHREATSSAASALGADFGTATPSSKSDAFRKLKPVYEGDTKQAKDTKKAYEVWLERRDKSEGKKKNPSGRHEPYGEDPPAHNPSGRRPREGERERYKSDVEHGKYSNPGGTPEVGVSTDTKVDVTTGTGYEERPHISVEEAGKLPRSTFNESGSELTVSGSQDSKDEPKFSQPADQEQPVRKAGLPQQHPNTYGVRYGMKGGLKKVWCPEHQVWEETRKDWHE